MRARTTLDNGHLDAVIAQEQQDGRFVTPEAMAIQDKSRRFYVNLHQTELQDERTWIDRQVYIALGTLLLGAAALEIDACPMEGFDAPLLDAELGLTARGLTSVVLVALGYRGADDFNARLPKSRLPEEGGVHRSLIGPLDAAARASPRVVSTGGKPALMG